MDYQTSKSRYILTVLAIIIVITAFVMVGLNVLMKQQSGPLAIKDRYQEGYVKGYEDARKKLRETGILNTPEITNILNGEVISVGKDSLVVRQTNLDTNPIVDNVPDERTITVTSSTKIFRRTNKDAATMDRELKAFEETVRTKPDAEPPDPSIIAEIKLSDIPIDGKVTIESNADVRLQKTVLAVIINLNSK